MQHVEVEFTFPLKNPDELQAELAKKGKPELIRQFQRDTYYNHPSKDFLAEQPIRDWLRIGETKHGAELNFKHFHNEKDNQAISCDEFETSISDVSATKKLLTALGCTELVVVEKYRSTWMLNQVELALDEVIGLGWYIELEMKGTFSSIDEARAALDETLHKINASIGQQDFRGYPHLMLIKEGKMKE